MRNSSAGSRLSHLSSLTDRQLAIFIFSLALVTRIIGVVLGGVRGDDSDGTYLRMAENFLRGQGFSLVDVDYGRLYSWLPPGMSFLYLFFLVVFGEVSISMRVFSVLLASITYVVYFALTKRLTSKIHALTATLCLIFYPPQMLWSTRINPHTYAMHSLVILIFLAFVQWERPRPWRAVWMGAVWAFVGLMRGEYMLGIGIFLITTLWASSDFRKGLKYTCLTLVGWTIIVAPWVIRNIRLHDRFVLISTNYADAFWEAYNPRYRFTGEMLSHPPELKKKLQAIENEVDRAHALAADARAYMTSHPLRVMYIVAGNALNFWRPWLSADAVSMRQNIVYVLSYVPLFLLFVGGLFLVPYRDPRWGLIIGFILYKFLIQIPFYVIVLYREGVMPLIILVATLPVVRYLEERRRSKSLKDFFHGQTAA